MTTSEKLRPKLAVRKQVEYMKNEKGIKFTITTEDEAVEFLSNNSYYFKVKAFEKNYNTGVGELKDKYINLEFAYLQELSKLDMYLRNIVLEMTLDIEHFVKVRMIKTISDDEKNDGYYIVKEFLDKNPSIKGRIQEKIDYQTSYISELAAKYIDNLPVWIFFELISFGDLIKFCEYYESIYDDSDLKNDNLTTVKYLRNAAAHNNCLINNLADISGNFTQSREANTFVSKIEGISEKTKNKKMSNRVVHDFVTMLVVFKRIVTSEQVKKNEFEKLKNLLEGRFLEHKDYFKGQGLLESNYVFIKKVVDKCLEN